MIKVKPTTQIVIVLFIYFLLGIVYIVLESKGKILVLKPIGATRHDQDIYHLPQINYFLNNKIDLGEYKSYTATTPGQHLLYTFILKQLNIRFNHNSEDKIIKLRILHLFFNILAIICIWNLFYSVCKNKLATLYLLPLIFSPYFINGALYITTDNVAIGLVALTLVFILDTKNSITNLFLGNVFNTISVFLRQNTIWLQIPMLSKTLSYFLCTKQYYFIVFHLLPIGLLTYFVVSWGGVVPKEFQAINARSLNFASIIYSISLYALLSLFYFYDFYTLVKKIEPSNIKKIFVAGLFIGLLLGILIPSEANMDKGRWGGYLWSASRYLPVFFERSTLFIFFTVLGTIHLTFVGYMLIRKNKYDVLVSFLAWLVFTVGSFRVFHRYFEPMLILFISIFTLILKENDINFSISPLILAFCMLCIFLLSIVL